MILDLLWYRGRNRHRLQTRSLRKAGELLRRNGFDQLLFRIDQSSKEEGTAGISSKPGVLVPVGEPLIQSAGRLV